jgi:glycosyltransferase involved in cell wall biosynthesis
MIVAGLSSLLKLLRNCDPWFASRQLSRRIERLELLLTEHGDAEATSFGEAVFSSPVVSVIMPTWNRARCVGAAIRSVQAQTFSDWELIVVDDGSSDDTAAVLKLFVGDSRIRYFKQSHAGQSAARNRGQMVAKAPLIAYLDSDNLWYPNFLAFAVGMFSTHPDVDCAYGAKVTDTHAYGILFEPFDRERLLRENFIGMSTFIHRRNLVDYYGAFDEELTVLEDWDLILRYTAHAPAYRLPVLAVRYRVMDDKRVSVTQPHHMSVRKIRHKWNSDRAH